MGKHVLSLVALFLMCIAGAQQRNTAQVRSFIAVMDVETGRERVLWSGERHFEAPNWSPDGTYLLLNSGGRLYKLPVVGGGEPAAVDTGPVDRVNNDHGISPDGKMFVISAGHMYTLPSAGGAPKQITQHTPSYYHGWSPDGRTLAYCARRNDNFDLYAIPVEGGEERRLTMHEDYDDGPDYSPDGKWIYFNSDRSGSWDIWRIPADGAGADDARAERITSDDDEDWFPHPSPSGRWMVWISFAKGTRGHPANQKVHLKLAPALAGKPAVSRVRVVKVLFGGQGTINVNSWAPDSRSFAYVRYELIQP